MLPHNSLMHICETLQEVSLSMLVKRHFEKHLL